MKTCWRYFMFLIYFTYSLISFPQRLPSTEEVNEKHSDMTLIACLLCERQFKSAEDLKKHQLKSKLHIVCLLKIFICIDNIFKSNLEAFRIKQMNELRSSLMAEAAKPQYRNRAAERRQLFGQPQHIKQHRSAPYPSKSSHPPIEKRYRILLSFILSVLKKKPLLKNSATRNQFREYWK